nr:hypothetical protein [Fretibacterium sp.]
MDEELWGQEIETENDGPALPGWKPIQERVISPLGQRQETGNKGLQMGSINLADFIRPATPEEIRRGDELHRRRVEYAQNSGIVDSIVHDVIHNTFEDDLELWETNPNEAARRFKMAKATGLSGDALKDPDIMSWAQREYARGLGLLDLQNAPERVVEWLANPGMMEIARDDIKVLSALGKALERLGASRAPEREGGWWDWTRQGFSSLFGRQASALEGKAQLLEGDPEEQKREKAILETNYAMNYIIDDVRRVRTPENLRKMAQGAREWEQWVSPEPYLHATGLWGVAEDVVTALPYTISGMPLNIATQAIGYLSGSAGIQHGLALGSALYSAHSEATDEMWDTYHQLIQQGMTPEEAKDRAFWHVYLPDVIWLTASDYIQNMLTLGGPITPAGPGAKGYFKGFV